MTTLAAAFYALAVWWSATQAILWLVRGVPKPAANAVALVLAIVSALLAAMAAHEATVHAAFVGFTAGIGLWAAFEISFLTGALLGIDEPARSSRLWDRAVSAFKGIVWHEAGLIGTLVLLLLASYGEPNPAAAATFGALWIMRASAKLNLFLGVRNLCTEFLPETVVHLSRHFRVAPMNGLLPFSVLFGTLAAAFLLREGLDPAALGYEAIAATLIATLVALGVLEHWLMVTPLSALAIFSTADGSGGGTCAANASLGKSSRSRRRDTLARPVGVMRTFG